MQTDLCSLKKGNKTPARLPIRKESSQKGLGRKWLSGKVREKGVGEGGGALCFGFSLALNVHLSSENLGLAVA